MSKDDFKFPVQRLAVAMAKKQIAHAPGTPSHWLNISPRGHLLQAATHLSKALLESDTDQDFIAQAAIELLMAIELEERAKAAREAHANG